MKIIRHIWNRCRSAVTGRFVSKEQAKANPRETVCEKIEGER